MTRPPQNSLGGKELSPLEFQELDKAAIRLLGPGGLTPDVAMPVAALMAMVQETGDARPERIINILVLAAYMLGAVAIERAHPMEALTLSGRIADRLGKALAEADRLQAGDGRA